MDWLLHNVVADLYGPYFLAFYALAIAALIVACYKSVRDIDRSRDLPMPEIPAKLDPYEIAYLRGGENEVTRVAVASLIQRGLLQICDPASLTAKVKTIDKGRDPESGELAPIEACVLKWPGFPVVPSRIFQPAGIPVVLKDACAFYEQEITEKHFLAPPEMKELGYKLWWIGSTFILGLGGYKLYVALAKGHYNVAFLCILGIGGVMALAVACMKIPRLSHLGKAYLGQLKIAFGGLNWRDDSSGIPTLAGNPSAQGRFENASAYSDSLMMVGIFGITSLAGTPLSELNTMFKRGASTAGCGAVGGGCGGGGGGCGAAGGGCGPREAAERVRGRRWRLRGRRLWRLRGRLSP